MREKINFTPDYGQKADTSIIKVIGVGGGGGNAVKHMYEEGIEGVNFLICNTDRGALESNLVPSQLVLGDTGLGAGADPNKARELAYATKDKLIDFIGKETKMLFITAGMGKGTGTGAAPVVAEIAKEMGILTIAVVTYPFKFEGEPVARKADSGIAELRKHVDSLIVVKNQNIIKYYNDEDMDAAFGYADDVLKNAVKCIAELITKNAEQNVDFNDVCTIMRESGEAMLGLAEASGENRVDEVVKNALSCPLLQEELITSAKSMLFFVNYGKITVSEFEKLTDKLEELQNQDSTVIWGRKKDESLGDAIKLSVIVTRYTGQKAPKKEMSPQDSNDNTDGPKTHWWEEVWGPKDQQSQDTEIVDINNINKNTDTNKNDDPFGWISQNQQSQPTVVDTHTQSVPTVQPHPVDMQPTMPSRPGQPQMISDNNDPRFEDNEQFRELVQTPAILRSQANGNAIGMTATMVSQRSFNFNAVEDDLHDFLSSNPD